MEETNGPGAQLPSPPLRLFDRLAQLPGYTWDQSIEPFHSSYDNWHVFGIRHVTPSSTSASQETSRSTSTNRSSPKNASRPSIKHYDTSASDATSDVSSTRGDSERTYIPVIARISTHALRLEREFHLCKSLVQTSDPNCTHTVKPIELLRLASIQGDRGSIVVSIFQSPGRNYLKELVDFGPAWFGARPEPTSNYLGAENTASSPSSQVPLSVFLDFAIGATECLELLHHGQGVVHGEIRMDSFHFSLEAGTVKLINFGSGPRSFENGLTSAGWLTLSREIGIKNKLQFIAPEQTGRMPAEPDSRTDIYSLGVLFWTMLTREPIFVGETPMDIIQSVLGRRITPVSNKRLDVPDIISSIIQKMTQKQIDERYHSASGLKYDLLEVQRILGDGDGEALKNFKIGTRDVSSFFILPTAIFGREEERKMIVNVIEKVSQRQQTTNITVNGNGLYSISSGSTMSDARMESSDNGEGSTSDASSAKRSRSNSAAATPPVSQRNNSGESAVTTMTIGKPPMETNGSRDTVNTKSSVNSHGESHRNSGASTGNGHAIEAGSVPRPRRSHKFRRKGVCEVITIIGAAGLGKSSLVQSVQGEIRRRGYLASAKFDQARRAPFEPVLKVMSSLFRQIFSESDLNTEYHNLIRTNIRAIWPLLSSMLDLPENLISLGSTSVAKTSSSFSQQGYSKSIRTEMRDSNSTHSSVSNTSGPSLTEPIRGGVTTRSLRFLSTFLEVLRVLSARKLICLCLDDLQFADEESLDLIASIITGKIRIVLMITCRDEEKLPGRVRSVLDEAIANITKIQVVPLSEEDVVDYVAATLYRPQEYVFPLAAVCLEKSRGNPFYLRQILEVCYQKNCLWYSWKNSAWEYDLDRVFKEFETEDYGQQLNTSFITRRLKDQLPPAARSILAWASLLGNTFSFSLVQRLLSGEFDYEDDKIEDQGSSSVNPDKIFSPQPVEYVVEGLQANMQAFILVAGENDDCFRFSHDRYVQAAASLAEASQVEKMHFIIAQTMMKYPDLDDRSLYTRAQHVCYAAGLIKQRISYRKRFRDLLSQAARNANNSGAKPTTLLYYENCLKLMQPDPWKDGAPDVYYEETLEIYTQAAEIYWHQGQSEKALSLLDSLFAHARTAADKAPAWIIQSRLHIQRGEGPAAFNALKTSLTELGLGFEKSVSWDACDFEYQKLVPQLLELNEDAIAQRPLSKDPNVISMGAVLIESMGVAFWSSPILYYQMATKMIEVYLQRGCFIQIGLGFCHFASIVSSRHGVSSFGRKIYTVSQQLLRRFNDTYTLGRGLTISTLFVAHLFTPIRDHLHNLEEAVEHTISSGDRLAFLVAVGALAISRLYLGHDLSELEAFCAYAADDVGDYNVDLRGSVLLTAVRQVARALQGKTWTDNASNVMSDEGHETDKYMEQIAARAANIERPRDVYNSLAMIPLYLYGHYEHVIQTGNDLRRTVHELWGVRNSRLTLFYLSLALLARARQNPSENSGKDVVDTVTGYKKQIELWQVECDVNYLMWSLLIEAECCEMMGDYHNAIQAYEAAIDTSQVHGFALEEAIAFELQGEFYIRRGAKRAARATLEDAIAAYAGISASGKVDQIGVKHEYLLKTATFSRNVDVGVQTANSIGDIGNTQFRIEENERQETRNLGKETAGDRTQAWLTPGDPKGKGKNVGQDVTELGLDVLDLQSILEFNQAISSELQIDRLLAKMTGIIMESAGAQADFAGVVTSSESDEGGWCIVASGTQDGISAEAVPLLDIEDDTTKQVLLYTLRFKETVFIHNLLHDERFSGNSSPRSVIALPILQGDRLLGVLYLEGQPNSFTDRNLGLLQLFCCQVTISIANALLFKRIRKVSASNTSMIASQKLALAKAREAENKAKLAEAEAMRNLRLKEEAAKAKSMFLANVSHELRTPLNGVIGMSELLKGTSLNKEQESYADSIRVCADTLLTVINDILDFSKLEAGKMKLFSVPLNLHETITEVVRALTYTNLERGLETKEDLDLDPTLLVVSDPIRLHQIFMNLLSNSYKFTAKGSVTVRARTDYEDERSVRVTCSVIDTGIGITQEQLSRLWIPFSQADSSTQRSYGGSGLGLSICKALINVLKGKIWLESQPGKGTTVSFTITFAKAPKEATTTVQQITALDPDPMSTWSSDAEVPPYTSSINSVIDLSHVSREQLKICIAEDNPINQKIAVSFVTKLGFKSEAYNDGMQAVEALRANAKAKTPFHLVLMDVQMPVLDGYDATKLIRQDSDPAVCSVLIIAMTASAIRGDREKCLEAGMNNYLAKPVRAAVLKTMLEDYLSQPPKAIPNLQETAKEIAKEAIEKVQVVDKSEDPTTTTTTTESESRRPSAIRIPTVVK